ncbi:aminoglycoside phosphotransferase family protein [Dactylosporangium sp. NPDC049140]|uniref:aminoglycoside phosphotransferase family protein n=1 Tax=Dactylosporangium sp. NPDC049140 TaxID=3155647 RepID=UPI00340D5526
MDIVVPASLRAMPRWWGEGSEWLDALPGLVAAQCRRWGLRVDGEVVHGSNALVVPVLRGDSALVLRMAPPGGEDTRALRFWNGRGTVLLVDADPATGATLLERLGESLLAEPVGAAVAVLGAMMRRLAVPAPDDVPSTADRVRERAARLEAEWQALGEPFGAAYLAEALRVAPALADTGSGLAVNGDLHSAQVLRGRREPWLAVDAVLLRGDIEFDLARVLWTRLDEMAGHEVAGHFDTAVAAAGVDRARARDWVAFRTVDYWLWGLGKGLTEDPQRCRRLMDVMMRTAPR